MSDITIRRRRRWRLYGGPVWRKVHGNGLHEWTTWQHVYEDTRHAAVVRRWWK